MPGTVWLTNRATGQDEPVAPEQVTAALASGKYLDPGAVAVHSDGADTYVPAEVARREEVYAPTIDPALAAHASGHLLRERANTGVGATVKAGLGGVVSGLSAGLVSPFEDQQEFNPIAGGIGQAIGVLAPALLGDEAGFLGLSPSALIGRAGAGTAERLGGGVLARAAGGAAEGALYGTGQAVGELARSSDPLTAEHIASTLSSNVLLGGVAGGVAGGAFASIERGLSRAGSALREATATRATLEGVSGDLAGLDDAGLVAARKAAATEHAADIGAERQSLEQLRVERRAELANEVRDLHNDLASERKVFHAVTGDDVAKIPGVSDIKVQLAKSFKSMRSAFDNPLGVAREPMALLKPLEQRQAALEALQGKAPELQAALAGDARAAALAHVDTALAETKGQIETIKALSSRNPVAGARLGALEAGPSARMQAIDAAREALKNAPEMGLIGKGATAAAFAGGTALAHMIPGVGIAAPFIGKAASNAVESLFTRMAGGVREVAGRSEAAASKFLDVATKAAPGIAALTATEALARARFGPGPAAPPDAKPAALPELFRARAGELRQQTMVAADGSIQMRPEARMAITRQLAPIAAVNPVLADRVETTIARKVAYMSSKIPKRPEVGGIQVGPDNWRPSELQIRSWARTVRACEDPHGVELRLAHGTVTPEDAEAYRTCFPERFMALRSKVFAAVPNLAKKLPTSRLVALYTFTGVPTMAALQPNVLRVLQSSFAVEPGTAGGTQAPKPKPAFGALGTPRAMDQPTPAQKRGG